MKINYVSVTKDYFSKTKEEKYIVRGELDCVPPLIWFRHLQLLWICSPKLFKLCPEPKLNKNEIIISIKNQEDILTTIDALKTLVNKIGYSYIIQSDQSLFLNFKESLMQKG
ncbi:MAG TPA: hypothetical protein GXX26_02925 [Clostridiaceae bacterium]|nr:hypothetical protein [Clostridiaceae bacterium]